MKAKIILLLVFVSSISGIQNFAKRNHPDQKISGSIISTCQKSLNFKSRLVTDYRDMGNVWINALSESDPDYVEMMSDYVLGDHSK